MPHLTPLLLNVLLIAHFTWHLVIAIGGSWSFFHSYEQHKKSKWKLAAAVIWFLLSILLLLSENQALHCN
jgi:drug/metabolite transporter superfamily protein YnfA